MRSFSYLLLVVPMLVLPLSCGQLATFCEAAPCPNFSPSGEVQPMPSLEATSSEVRPGEVKTLQVHVDLQGAPVGTPLRWVRPTNVTGPDTVLLDVPGHYRVEAAANPFIGDTSLTLTVSPDAPAGPLAYSIPVLALKKVNSQSGYGPLPLAFTVVR